MLKTIINLFFCFSVFFILLCSPQESPYTNPKDAKIIKENSLRSLDAKNDSIKINTTLQCTVEVTRPKLIDSFFVYLNYSGKDTLIASGIVNDISFNFSLSIPRQGIYDLNVIIVKIDNSKDTLTKTVFAYALSPQIIPDSLSYTVFMPQDSFVFKFTVLDLDSNVRFAYTWIDSILGPLITFTTAKPFMETFSRTVYGPYMLSALKSKRNIICAAMAIDIPDSNSSSIALCTLFVRDTIKPTIKLITPQDTSSPITSLPVTIRAIIKDICGITSAKFNDMPMTLENDTTFALEISSLDSGKHLDSIIAIDIYSNQSKLVFSLTYQGKQLYPPQIKDVSKAITEGKKFDTLLLDTCVIIKDTTIANKLLYAKDSITWIITDTAGNQLTIPANHKFVISQPADTEWAGVIKLTFKAFITNKPSLYDLKQLSFFVTEIPDPPKIILSQYWCSNTGYSDTVHLDTISTVKDPDNALSSLSWEFKHGKHFKVDSIYSSIFTLPKKTTGIIGPIIPGKVFARKIRIIPKTTSDTSFYGTDTLSFAVKDPTGLSDVKLIYFTHTTKTCLQLFYPTFP